MAQDDTEDARCVSTAVDIEMTMTNDDPKLLKHAPDADEAMKAFEEMQGEAIELDEATNRRLVRTIDWHIMPIMCFVYAMNFLDSMLFNSARIFDNLCSMANMFQKLHCPMPVSWV
jgi:ACS family allantoate permease-like MFS transporter